MFIPSTFKRPVSTWKALNLRKTLLMASSVRLKPLNCSRLPCVYAQETLTFLLTQKKTCVKNYVHFFFQAEDGIRAGTVTGAQTCALPIFQQDFSMPPMPSQIADEYRVSCIDAVIAHFSMLVSVTA